MIKYGKLFFTIATLLCGSFLVSQEDSQELFVARQKARIEAAKRLNENIQQLQITDSIKIQDFIYNNDKRKKHFEVFLGNLEEINQPEFKSGKCCVTIAVTLEQMITELQQIYLLYPSKDFCLDHVYQVRNYNRQRIFYAIGCSDIPSKMQKPWEENFWKRVNNKGKEIALQQAQVDAYRNITEIIKEVKISPDARVKNFLIQSEEIRDAFNRFIRSVKIVNTQYKPEGVVEVTVEIEIPRLVDELADICNNYYDGDYWDQEHFSGIYTYAKVQSIRAIGTGVPPADYIKNTQIDIKKEPSKYVPQWANGTIRVTSSASINRVTAKQATRMAQLYGYQLLTEQVLKLELETGITVKDFFMQNQSALDTLSSFIQGAKITHSRTDSKLGIIELEMELSLNYLWQIIETSDRFSGKDK